MLAVNTVCIMAAAVSYKLSGIFSMYLMYQQQIVCAGWLTAARTQQRDKQLYSITFTVIAYVYLMQVLVRQLVVCSS
jgi:hypothetical protein